MYIISPNIPAPHPSRIHHTPPTQYRPHTHNPINTLTQHTHTHLSLIMNIHSHITHTQPLTPYIQPITHPHTHPTRTPARTHIIRTPSKVHRPTLLHHHRSITPVQQYSLHTSPQTSITPVQTRHSQPMVGFTTCKPNHKRTVVGFTKCKTNQKNRVGGCVWVYVSWECASDVL